MTYELYWNSDPLIAKAYKEAYLLKCKADNEKLWLQGLYNFNAISTALSNIHLDGKSHKPNLYLEQPIDIFEKTEEEKTKEAEKAKQKVIAQFSRLKEMWDARKKG